MVVSQEEQWLEMPDAGAPRQRHRKTSMAKIFFKGNAGRRAKILSRGRALLRELGNLAVRARTPRERGSTGLSSHVLLISSHRILFILSVGHYLFYQSTGGVKLKPKPRGGNRFGNRGNRYCRSDRFRPVPYRSKFKI
jgi:hypothetical protein